MIRHVLGARRRRRADELAQLDRWRVARRQLDEDVTVLGEQLAELHVDTLGGDLDPETFDHYRRALTYYDQAKHLLAVSTRVDDLVDVKQVIADARYHRAAVIALRDGAPVPLRRDPCFFDPRHGPSVQDVEWSPPGGTPRRIAVCAADARHLTAGEAPLERLVRVGDRWVPWHLAGGARDAVDAGARLAHQSGHGVHGQQNLAQAYLNQAVNGVSGPNSPSS